MRIATIDPARAELRWDHIKVRHNALVIVEWKLDPVDSYSMDGTDLALLPHDTPEETVNAVAEAFGLTVVSQEELHERVLAEEKQN